MSQFSSHPRIASNCRIRFVLCLVAAACLGVAHGETTLTGTNREPLAVWDVSSRGTVGGGYRGNVLLSSIRPVGSSFLEASADFSAIRLSESGSSLTLFLLGEYQHYFETQEGQNQGLAYAVARAETPFGGPQNIVGAEFQYLYQDQILDVSETEITERRARVLGNSFSSKPYWQHDLGHKWSLKLEGSATRQLFEEDLDDYWEGYARVRFARAYGTRSSVALGYELRHRFYDTREQYDLDGVSVPGTGLIYRYHEVAGEWQHHWDANRNWRTTLKAGFLRNEDNGSGYFNYDRTQISAGVRWQKDPWYVRLQGRAGWYWYPNQDLTGEERVRSFYALDLRTEYQLAKHWMLYAAASREWNLSNDPLEEYNDWVASAGIGVEI